VIAQFYYFIRERKNIESFVIISDKKMSLADELLADLEEMDGGQGASQDQNNLSKALRQILFRIRIVFML
jgi:hypothetical protein